MSWDVILKVKSAPRRNQPFVLEIGAQYLWFLPVHMLVYITGSNVQLRNSWRRSLTLQFIHFDRFHHRIQSETTNDVISARRSDIYISLKSFLRHLPLAYLRGVCLHKETNEFDSTEATSIFCLIESCDTCRWHIFVIWLVWYVGMYVRT